MPPPLLLVLQSRDLGRRSRHRCLYAGGAEDPGAFHVGQRNPGRIRGDIRSSMGPPRRVLGRGESPFSSLPNSGPSSMPARISESIKPWKQYCFFPWSSCEDILESLDFLFVDINIWTAARTNGSRGSATKHIEEYQNASAPWTSETVVRVPLVRGANDDEDRSRADGEFVEGTASPEKDGASAVSTIWAGISTTFSAWASGASRTSE